MPRVSLHVMMIPSSAMLWVLLACSAARLSGRVSPCGRELSVESTSCENDGCELGCKHKLHNACIGHACIPGMFCHVGISPGTVVLYRCQVLGIGSSRATQEVLICIWISLAESIHVYEVLMDGSERRWQDRKPPSGCLGRITFTSTPWGQPITSSYGRGGLFAILWSAVTHGGLTIAMQASNLNRAHEMGTHTLG